MILRGRHPDQAAQGLWPWLASQKSPWELHPSPTLSSMLLSPGHSDFSCLEGRITGVNQTRPPIHNTWRRPSVITSPGTCTVEQCYLEGRKLFWCHFSSFEWGLFKAHQMLEAVSHTFLGWAEDLLLRLAVLASARDSNPHSCFPNMTSEVTGSGLALLSSSWKRRRGGRD